MIESAASQSRVAQWKRAGPITQRSVDRNHALLITFCTMLYINSIIKPIELEELVLANQLRRRKLLLVSNLHRSV